MFRILLLAFLIAPMFEIYVMIKVGQWIGAWQTIVLMVLGGILGAYLAKSQGLLAWRRFQTELSMGRMPGDSILDGAFVLVGGLLLMTPGFVSDLVGLTCLIPFTRAPLKNLIKKLVEKKLSKSTWVYYR